jgi:glycosyltransferase involved in cell wall biosynthesis
MLCVNDWRFDTRVTREAEAVAADGHEVCVVFRADRAEEDAVRSGVRYRCVPRSGVKPGEYPTLVRMHAEVLPVAQRIVAAMAAIPAAPIGAAMVALSRRFEGARRMVAYAAEPLVYLNEFALRCEDIVVAERPDVIHAHDLVTLSCGARAARRTGAALIYDAHELETGTNYWSLNTLTHASVRQYERLLIQEADGVITVSRGIADWLAAHYGIAQPTVVQNVPVTLAPGAAAHRGGALRSRLQLGSTTPLAVYVGAATVDRGLEQCVSALSHYQELHLALLGQRYPETERTLRAIASTTQVAERLHFVDPVPSADVSGFIADADCALVPIQNVCLSYELSLPNKLFESILAGLPVVASDLPEIRNVVATHGVGVVMNERDPADIARAVREVVGARDRFAPTGDKLAAVIAEHGWPVQRERLRALYRRLPSPSARRS